MTQEENIAGAITATLPTWAQEMGKLYLPAITRMGLEEFAALLSLINQKKTTEAQAAVRDSMTAEELATEKQTLTPIIAQMADARHEALELLNNILLAGIKAGILLAMGAAGF